MATPQRRRAGRNTAPAQPASLGADVRTIQSTITVEGAPIPFVVNRQVLDVDEDADYDPDKHAPSEARKAALERADLNGGDLYENPYEETGRLRMKPAPGEVEAFRAYVHNNRFRANIQRFSELSAAATDHFERMRIGRETTAAGANVRLAMLAAGSSVADRLADASMPSLSAAAREALLPPAAPSDTDRIQVGAAQTVARNDLMRLLSTNPVPGLTAKARDTFFALPCINTIARVTMPHTMVAEQHKRHVNIVELVSSMVNAGCKYHSISRVETSERLVNLLDPEHYGSFIATERDGTRTLRGGHEHYDARTKKTRLVVVHFYCVLRPKQTAEEQQKVLAERLAGLAAQAAKEDEVSDRFDPDDDLFLDAIGDNDADYTSGNDLHDPSSHFIYRCNIVCVEAVDCVCANHARTPVRQRKKDARVRLDGSAESESDDSEPPEENSPWLPDGIGKLPFFDASILVGKFRAAAFMANCQGARPLYPLCIRSVQFSPGETALPP